MDSGLPNSSMDCLSVGLVSRDKGETHGSPPCSLKTGARRGEAGAHLMRSLISSTTSPLTGSTCPGQTV